MHFKHQFLIICLVSMEHVPMCVADVAESVSMFSTESEIGTSRHIQGQDVLHT